MLIKGSNNAVLNVYINENNRPLIMTGTALTGTTVSVDIKCGGRPKFTKSDTIVANGLLTVHLTSDELSTAGTYQTQATVYFPDGSKFISDVNQFPVGDTL